MAARLRQLVQPLVDAGWTTGAEDRDSSAIYGDSVFLDLHRADEWIQLELYEDGGVVGYDLQADDDESSPSLFNLSETSPESRRSAFEEQGWLDPA